MVKMKIIFNKGDIMVGVHKGSIHKVIIGASKEEVHKDFHPFIKIKLIKIIYNYSWGISWRRLLKSLLRILLWRIHRWLLGWVCRWISRLCRWVCRRISWLLRRVSWRLLIRGIAWGWVLRCGGISSSAWNNNNLRLLLLHRLLLLRLFWLVFFIWEPFSFNINFSSWLSFIQK